MFKLEPVPGESSFLIKTIIITDREHREVDYGLIWGNLLHTRFESTHTTVPGHFVDILTVVSHTFKITIAGQNLRPLFEGFLKQRVSIVSVDKFQDKDEEKLKEFEPSISSIYAEEGNFLKGESK